MTNVPFTTESIVFWQVITLALRICLVALPNCRFRLVLCVLFAWLAHHAGYGDLYRFSTTLPRIAWPQAVLSTFLLPNLPTLSCAMLLLVLFGRAVELDSGPLALCLFYVTGGVATNFLCHLAMVSAPAGLAATGGLFALVFMGLAVTLKDTLRLKRLGRLVKVGPNRY